jgi:acyl-CoA synthetase (AMP-forming)/AMP-acid ligase II
MGRGAQLAALKPGTTLSEENLIKYFRERLATFTVPRLLTFVSEPPKTGSGKILNGELWKAFGMAH